jgi:GT2 family glycosyltransferase
MHDITFGITAFNRPQLLRELIESIRARYPHVRIVVADNGDQHAALPDDVEVIRLPFDCGLSRARNALIDHLKTEYLLVLEDDFQFTSETDVEPLRRVLDAAPDIGVVGGAIRGSDGRVTCYALDIEVCRKTMRVREATHRKEVTPCGVPYRLCDMVWNFALFRRAMLREHRWVDALKIGEHCPYFYEVKLGGRWRVASCSLPKIYHVPGRRPADYLKYRQRAARYFQAYLAARGIQHYERVLPYHYEDSATLVPPVIVLAVGHSGTSVATRMLQKLGWNLGQPVDRVFAEHIEIRKLNRQVIDRGRLDHDAARHALSSLPMPWALKDPRFVQTLQHWFPLFSELETKPVVLRLRRELTATKHSYRLRGAPGDVDRRIEQLAHSRDRLYDLWPWARFTLEYEKIAAAVSVFDLARYEASRETLSRLRAAAAAERSAAIHRADEFAVESDSSTAVAAALAADSSPAAVSPLAVGLVSSLLRRSATRDSSMDLNTLMMDGSSMVELSVDLDSSLPPLKVMTEELAMELDSSVGQPADEDVAMSGESYGVELLERKIRRQLQVSQRGTMGEMDDGSDS